MPWNWQLPDWPKFKYNKSLLVEHERDFLIGAGGSFAFLKNIDNGDFQQFVVEILSSEGLESARIEGELLDRESLQSSIRQHFGMKENKQAHRNQESGMAKLLCAVYKTFDEPLTHEMLWQWHSNLFEQTQTTIETGKYRSHPEPMQIVSNKYGSQKVFFEAPPSAQMKEEMSRFIEWFNGSRMEPILGRAASAHVYFESIHPFEDGNGRIGRALVEKILSQGVNRPVLVALSKVLEKERKEYYAALGRCNCTLEVDEWSLFFAKAILQAQAESMNLLKFLIEKTRLMTKLAGQINERQEKVLLRLFAEGPAGFKGGLSAENYMAITKASRATITRDLADLVEKGALRKTGTLRHTRYWLNFL